MINTSNPNHSAHIVVLSNVEKHPNADRLQKAKAFGAGIVVGLDAKEGDIGVYFQSGLALDPEFAKANDLIRRKNPVTGAAEGGMLDANCRIRTQKFRGESSDGLFLPLDSLWKVGVDPGVVVNLLKPGDFFTELEGIKICDKYVIQTRNSGGASSKLPRTQGSIMFKEHYDTAQLRFNLDKISPDDYIVVTEKVHGTSQRVGNVQKKIEFTSWKKFIGKLLGVKGVIEWQDMVGTRRTVVSTDGILRKPEGYYNNDFRCQAAEPFLGKLHKGETIYYEVVGYAGDKSIMGTVDNEKLGPEFVARYGKKTVFKYGCAPGKFDVYVYRITLTNEDGYSIDYTWDAIEKRCEELGVKVVPVLHKSVACLITLPSQIKNACDFKSAIEKFADEYVKGPSNLDPEHIKEGIVIRVEGSSCPKTYKHKSFEFKVLEGIIKPETASVDESSEL
jgi:hypothetical protein